MTNQCKGIILAGGSGTRLYPMTNVTNKHLLPVFDKPMIYYPLTTLMLAGIREVGLISTPEDIGRFEDLLGDGSQWGMSIEYFTQARPGGLPEAFIIAEQFISNHRVCLVLGDNIFYGHGLPSLLQAAAVQPEGATLFAQSVRDPHRFGVVRFGPDGQPAEFLEKPVNPPSDQAITGLYFYDSRVVEFARELVPSARGELEITDLNNQYLEIGRVEVVQFGRGMAWLDAGTPESLAVAGQLVQTIETLQNTRIACPEEVAFRMGLINQVRLQSLVRSMPASAYREYLEKVMVETPEENA